MGNRENIPEAVHIVLDRTEGQDIGRFPFNGLTGQTQIVFLCINGNIWSMFLKYLAKMDLIQMLSKFSGQIGPKSKRFVFHSTI
jgi:hypothetical protein